METDGVVLNHPLQTFDRAGIEFWILIAEFLEKNLAIFTLYSNIPHHQQTCMLGLGDLVKFSIVSAKYNVQHGILITENTPVKSKGKQIYKLQRKLLKEKLNKSCFSS